MLILILSAATAIGGQQVDSAYTSAALRAIVERAAERNAAPPAWLATYSARVETEVVVTLS
ncbi:MAG: hypothetical protein ACREMA_03615, partial [Longimicrobiales bacterium]